MENNKRVEKCYKCRGIATSREHVPPLCLFPERKDIGKYDFRKNLLTVPSCDEHNSGKAKDDEFFMATIAGIVGNNVIGYVHTQTKVKRALDRKTDAFKHSQKRSLLLRKTVGSILYCMDLRILIGYMPVLKILHTDFIIRSLDILL